MPYIQTSTGLWEAVIGLEVHAQVISNAKLFSHASTKFGAMPNENVSFVDAALPGVLPVINEFCVDQAIKTGLALNAKINLVSHFDRKNYFYPDLPQGYQISQFKHPIVSDGLVTVETEDGTKRDIRIERIHLEQDAGKSIHDQNPTKSLIDLNRAGIALMEIVTHPDMRSAEEAALFLKKLRAIFRCIKTCDGNMEEGSMRADVNISIHRPGTPFGTRAEIKNVNSIRFLAQAINYEINRQIDILESGGEVDQETRLFNSNTGETRLMRSKEDAQDYRYFPDPDLPALILSEERINRIREELPELPDQKCSRFQEEYGLPKYDAELISSDSELSEFYELSVSKTDGGKDQAKLVSNWLIGELFAFLNRENLTIIQSPISAENLASLTKLISDGVISSKIAKEVFEHMWASGESPDKIVKEKGLVQISDVETIRQEIMSVLSANEDKVSEYRSGKEKLFGFFVGQIMKKTGGKLNPKLLNETLTELLKG